MKTSTFIIFLFFVYLCAFPPASYAQEKTIYGYVSSFDSIPLIGAQIKVISTKEEGLTDTTGYFEMNCNNKDKIKVSANGFYTQRIKFEESTKNILVNLESKNDRDNVETASWRGEIFENDKGFTIPSLSEEDVNFSLYPDVYEIIKGQFAGVDVYGGEIIIRGVSSLDGSNSALIVVDEIIQDNSILETLPTQEIKSIKVIKDGGAAIYGSRGGNGVILITTKARGK